MIDEQTADTVPVLSDAGLEKLTDQQKEFVLQLERNGWNATQAARDSGYSKKAPRTAAHQVMKSPKVKAAIQYRMNMRAKELGIGSARILAQAMLLAFANMSDFVDIKNVKVGGKMQPRIYMKDWSKIDRNLLSAVQSLKQYRDGSIEIKLHDKKQPLELVAKMLGATEEENEGDKGHASSNVVNFTNVNLVLNGSKSRLMDEFDQPDHQ